MALVAVLFVNLVVVDALALLVTPPVAFAAGTVLFQNQFNNRTVDGIGTVTVPAPTSGTNVVCLTAAGNNNTPPVRSCSGASDAQGAGKLRLTNSTANQVGGVFGQGSFPTSNGLDVTFNSYQWGGGSADGIAFMLAAVDPANPTPPASIGSSGGALGYSAAPGLNGLSNAYLGVGLDVYGNFSNPSYQGTGCTNPANISAQTSGSVVVRGPGNIKVGYCGLASTFDGTAGSKVVLRAGSRTASVVPVQVLINPTTAAFTSDSGVTVAAGTYKVVITPVGQATRTLSGALPVVPANLYPSSSWLNANGVPKQLVFGFVGSTGSVTDVHEVANVNVLTFNPVPQLGIDTTSYSATTSLPGDPVTYVTTAKVLAGANENSAISVTQTVAAGVVPVGAFGAGWVCQARVAQTITCVTSGTTFASGAVLPPITIVAIATAPSTSSTVIQTGSPTSVSSIDANPATDVLTVVGTRPTGPSALTVTPAIGVITGGGGVTIGGAAITSATAIEIGTTAEQQAGTPVTLLPCPGAAAVGCFTVSGTTLVISSMPPRATSSIVGITVVTAGVAAAVTYTYADRPATPSTPAATAVIGGATITWTAPAANGSAVTGYMVTAYRNGVAQVAQSFDASTTTRTITGLTTGASYTFTIAAVNAYGTSVASANSAIVIPYVLPGAPAITAASASTSGATLTWAAPSNGGNPISGYVVTPFIGAAAQPPRTFGAGTTQTVTGLTPGTAYTFTVAAQNLAGTGPSSAPSSPVTPNAAPSLNFPAAPAGEVGATYNWQLNVVSGTAPFAWSVSAGALPGGLSLHPSTGLVSGTPTTAGTFAITVQVIDASGQIATRPATIGIAALPTLTFNPAPGEVGVAFSQQPVVAGGTAPFVWSISAGSLPSGVVLNTASGLVSGTPGNAGTFTVTVVAKDAMNQSASKTVGIVIVARPVFTTEPVPTGQVGVAYSATLGVVGGALPLLWSITAGTLPAGLTVNRDSGVVSGTPGTVGSSTFSIEVVDANGVTAVRNVTIAVGPGPLVITRSANVSTTVAGGNVAFTISITNTSSTTWTGVALADPLSGVLDDAVYAANAVASSGTLTYNATVLNWSGNIAAAASVTITYSVTVDAVPTGDKVLRSAMTSTTLGTNCAIGGSDARCTTTVAVASLDIVKTADVASAIPGDTVHIDIAVTNTGQAPYTAVTLTENLADLLDDATYNGDGSATAGSLSYAASVLSWTGPLAVGATVTLSYSVVVSNPNIGNRLLAGAATSSSLGSPCPATNPAPRCSDPVTVLVPALTIVSSAGATTVTPGGTVGVTITATNTGQTAYVSTSVSLHLSAALDDAIYTGDAAASSGVIVFDSATQSLVWTGNLAIGAAVTITASLLVRDPDTGDMTVSTLVTSSASGSTCPVGTTSAACRTSTPVRVPQLTIASSTSGSTTEPGATVTHTITVTNTGQTAYTSATFSDSLLDVFDDADDNDDAAATTGIVTSNGSNLIWTGALAIGASATITFSVTVHDPLDGGDLDLDSRVTSTTPGNTCPSGSSNPQCSTSVSVLVPRLTVASSIEATTTPGDVVHYSVVVTNAGETTYRNTPITLDLVAALDDAVYNNDAAITAGELVTNLDGTVDWIVTLAPGASATGTISMTVNNPAAGDRSLRITAVSTASGSNCQVGSTAPGCIATATVLQPGLTISKFANTSTITPGETVGYTISVHNTGVTTYGSANITDDLSAVLPDSVYAGDATASTGTVLYAAPKLTWTGALAPGESAVITYSITVRDPDPGDKRMVNTVVSTSAGSNCAIGSTDPRCSAVVTVLIPGLTFVKTVDSPTAVAGSVVTYTISATNSGTAPLVGANLSDSLSGVLDDATFNDDAASSSGVVSLVGSSVVWIGDLSVGATTTISYSVTVRLADDGDDRLIGPATSTSRGNNCEADSTDTRCSTTVRVARLILSQSYPQTGTTPGSVIRLSATFTNTGQVPYVGISIVSASANTVDDAIPTGDQTATSGTLVLSTTAITWTGDIPVGGTVDVTGTLTVQNPDPGDKIITGTLVSAAPGNNCPAGGTDPRCTARINVLIPQLTIVKSASTTVTVGGGSIGYTITIHNSGQSAYVGATVTDSLRGVLDDADYDGDASASVGQIALTGAELVWTGDLAAGATAVVTYHVTVHGASSGDKTIVNPVSSTATGSTCPPASGNPSCHTTVVVLTPGLTISATSDVDDATLGSSVIYFIRVVNSGQTPYASAGFTNSLIDVLDDAALVPGSTTATSGSVANVGGEITWSGPLAPGASATVSYTVVVDNPSTGDRDMASRIVSASAANNCAPGSTDTRCTAAVAITDAVSLTFTKTSDVAATTAGATVVYAVTVVNSSSSPVLAANFTDPLSDIVDDATYNNDAVATSGDVEYSDESGPRLTWTGTIEASSTVTVSYSVTVHPTTSGEQILAGTVSSTSLPASNNCIDDSTDPRCANTVPIAALLIQQSYTDSSTTPGSVLRLSATFTNTGAMPYEGISISSPSANTVDDATPVGDETATSGTLVLSATAITWTGNIPVGATVTITGTLTVKSSALGNRQIEGTLVSAALGNNCPAGGVDPRCTASIAVLLPGLTITTTATAPFVVPGGTVGYTITIRNSGETAYVGAVVTDTLIGILDDTTYNANATSSTGSVSFSSPVLTWTGDLALGQTATVSYSVTASNPPTGDKTMVNPVTSTEAGSTCPPASGTSACRTTVVVLTPSLTISSSVDAVTATAGVKVNYTVTIANTGQTPYAAATVSMPLAGVVDDAGYNADASSTTGTVTVTTDDIIWTGALGLGATATVTYSVTVSDAGTGDHRLQQTVRSASAGSSCPAATTHPRCITSVSIANLQILNQVDVATAAPNDVVRYTVTFTNSGQVPYVGISIDARLAGSLDDATYNGDAVPSAGNLTLFVGTGRIVWNGDLAVGQTVTVTGSVTVNNPVLGDRSMTTMVTTDVPGSNCPVIGAGPACRTTVTVLTPALTLSIVADTVTAIPGQTVGYTVIATNSGETPYVATTISQSLVGALADAAYNNDVPATATSGVVALDGQVLRWTGDLAIGASVIIGFSVKVDDPDLGDRYLVVSISSAAVGSTCPVGGTLPSCVVGVPVLIPVIDIAVTADRTSALPGDAVRYTVAIRNIGETPSSGATVTIHLAAALDDAEYANDAVATAGAVSPDGTDLVWTGDIAIGATVIVTYSVTVSDIDEGDHTLSISVSSFSAGSTCGDAAGCTSSIPVLIPGLDVSIAADRTDTTPGGSAEFHITLTNTGQSAYPAASFTAALGAVLDDGAVDGDPTASTGTVISDGATISWAGSLAVGASATIVVLVIVDDPDLGDRTLSMTVLAPDAGSTCRNSSVSPACTATVAVLVPALHILTTVDAPTTTPGGQVVHTIVITNTGETAFGGVTVVDSLTALLADASYDGDAAVDGGGIVTATGDAISWTGDLALAAVVTVTFTVTVDNPDVGTHLMRTTVTSSAPGSTCVVGTTSPECSTVVTVLTPELLITVTAAALPDDAGTGPHTTVVAGRSVRYTVVVANTGETPYASAGFVDATEGLSDDAIVEDDATATIGTVESAEGTVSWNGSLPIGASATITYTVTTLFPAGGDHMLVNSVTSADVGARCADGGSLPCSATLVVLVPALSITTTADRTDVVEGGSVSYSIVATNTGEADYDKLTLVGVLADVLDDAASVSDAVATAGSVTIQGDQLRWTGTLPTAASVIVTYSVVVAPIGSGNGVLHERVMSDAVGSTCVDGTTDPLCSAITTVAAASVSVSGVTESFILTGQANTTVGSDGAVTLTVRSNNPGGYVVAIQATEPSLTGADPANTMTIGVDQLRVRESGTSAFQPLSADESVVVHQQAAESAPLGDAISNDFEVAIPFVQPDSYSTTLEYIVSTQ